MTLDLPDVVVVVLDCVNADALRAEVRGAGTDLSLGGLVAEAVVYDHAVSPGTWTVPAHATLLTGLYPWNTGCFARSSADFPSLDPGVVRVHDVLKTLGYRTICVSGNPVLGPRYGCGLDTRFDSVSAAEPWEYMLRFPPKLARLAAAMYRTANQEFRNGNSRGHRGWAIHEYFANSVRRLSLQVPASVFCMQRLAVWGFGTDGTSEIMPSPWIEDTFDQYLAGSPDGLPLFALINLIDAHEPYFPHPSLQNGTDYIDLVRQRQDFSSLMTGDWTPSSEEYSNLRKLYADAVHMAVTRVSRVVRLLKQRGRWDNTLFIVTSDHGQALGEHGLALHGGPPVEALARVPLIIHYPNRAMSGSRVCSEWTSLADITPTILTAAGVPLEGRFDGIALQDLDAAQPSNRIVQSYGEGLILWNPDRQLAGSVRNALDREAVATYGGRFKLVRSLRPPGAQVYDVEADAHELNDLSNHEPPEIGELRDSASAAIVALQAAKTRSDARKSVSDRLRLWGYG
jgi:arylsulfatase A-like enzyme